VGGERCVWLSRVTHIIMADSGTCANLITPEVVKLAKKDVHLPDIVADPTLRQLFVDFLEKEMMHENFLFWLDVEEYNKVMRLFSFVLFVFDLFVFDLFVFVFFVFDLFVFDLFVFDLFVFDLFVFDLFVFDLFVFDLFVFDLFVFFSLCLFSLSLFSLCLFSLCLFSLCLFSFYLVAVLSVVQHFFMFFSVLISSCS